MVAMQARSPARTPSIIDLKPELNSRSLGAPPLHSEGEVILDARGHLVRGFERSWAARIDFSREGDVLRLHTGQQRDEVSYRPEQEDVGFMAHSVIFHEELILGSRALKTGAIERRLLSLSGGVPVAWKAQVRAQDDGTVEVRTSLGEVVQLKDRRIVEIGVDDDDVKVRALTPAPSWPSWSIPETQQLTYAPPPEARFSIREVELGGQPDDPRLVGEVLIPKGGKSPFPAALVLSAAGQNDRYGHAGPPPVDLGYHAVTDALANAGFVVLRYDERGFGGSAKGELSFAAQVQDARRALNTLLVQQEVDADRIVLVGHGEGGWRALMLAGRRQREVQGVALLATPGRPYVEVWTEQAKRMLQEVPSDLRAQVEAQQRELLENLRLGGVVPPELQPQARWIREVMTIKPDELLGEVRCPVWLAQGGKDFEVDPASEIQTWRAMAKRQRRRLVVKRYPQLDHLFKLEPGQSTPDRYLETRPVAQQLLDDLVAWAKQRTRAPGKRR